MEHREVTLPARPPRLSTEAKIERLRRRIAIEREVSRASVLIIIPKVEKTARILGRLRGLPRLAARFAPVLLPLASMVFRKNPAVRTAVRAWGVARLVQGVARAVSVARRKSVVEVVPVQS